MKYNIFAFEIGVSKVIFYSRKNCLKSSFYIFFRLDIYLTEYLKHALLFIYRLSPVLIVFKQCQIFSNIFEIKRIQKLTKNLHKFTMILISLISSLLVLKNWSIHTWYRTPIHINTVLLLILL